MKLSVKKEDFVQYNKAGAGKRAEDDAVCNTL